MTSTTTEPELNLEIRLRKIALKRGETTSIDKWLSFNVDDILALIQQVSDQRVREFSSPIKKLVEEYAERFPIVKGDAVPKENVAACFRTVSSAIDQTLADYLSLKGARDE